MAEAKLADYEKPVLIKHENLRELTADLSVHVSVPPLLSLGIDIDLF